MPVLFHEETCYWDHNMGLEAENLTLLQQKTKLESKMFTHCKVLRRMLCNVTTSLLEKKTHLIWKLENCLPC